MDKLEVCTLLGDASRRCAQGCNSSCIEEFLKPLCHPLRSLGTNFETKIVKFRWFLGPSDQNELYHTPLLSKI